MSAIEGIAYTEVALKCLETTIPTKICNQLRKRIEALKINPTPPGSKKLQGISDGLHPIYRVRQGDYRVLYSIRDTVILVLDIGHRKEIYR
jgi:mRNA interferase RelE/StbE